MRVIYSWLLAIAVGLPITNVMAAEYITYNGTDCSFTNLNAGYEDVWIPTPSALYGNNTVGTSLICPVATQSATAYTNSKISWAGVTGSNMGNPRLCFRDQNGAINCGNNFEGYGAWILHKPGVSVGQYDNAFIVINGVNGTSVVKSYRVYWSN